MIKQTQVRYLSDGLDMHGVYFADESHEGLRPAIILYPEAFGPGEHARQLAHAFVGLGYRVFMCDMHGEGAILPLAQVGGIVLDLWKEPERVRARAQDGLDCILRQDGVDPRRIGAIGYCFGGALAVELARSGADIAAAVGIHSTLSTPLPAQSGMVKAKILVCYGDLDPVIGEEQRNEFVQEMRNAGADWRMQVYGGVKHSFTNIDAAEHHAPEALQFDETANRLSWNASVDIFAEAFAQRAAAAG